ncbi:MAG: hypothetical protein HYW25_01325 [Candidatus Aenigmarchaeota archaeon]|nr:hypothetical protein [Candidatus Aenigmarchaeota archaeon]
MDFTKPINPSKHFRNTWMRNWDWDMNDLRSALVNAYKIDKAGANKYEAYVRKGGKSRKIIFAIIEDETFIITGSEKT